MPQPSQNEVALRWQKKVASFDGFIFTAAEYNHAATGVLKNAIDYAANEWNKKPAGFVGYGSVGGARDSDPEMLAVAVFVVGHFNRGCENVAAAVVDRDHDDLDALFHDCLCPDIHA